MTARKKPVRFCFAFWGSHCAGEIPGVAGSSSLADGDQVFSGSCGLRTLQRMARGGRPEALGNVNNPTSRIRGRVESYHLGGKAGLFSLYGGSRSVSVGVMT